MPDQKNAQNSNKFNYKFNHNFYLILFFLIMLGFYSLEYFFRISPGLVLPELMQQYDIGPLGIAYFSSFFYFGYVIFQIPSGLLLDKISTKWPLALLLFLSSLFFIVFLNIHSFWLGALIRFLIGGLSSISFIAVLFFARKLLKSNWLTFISGLAISIGSLAASFIQTINALLMPYFPWQMTLTLFSTWGILLAVLLALIPKVIYPKPQNQNKIKNKIKNKNNLFKKIGSLLRTQNFLSNALLGGLIFSPTSLLTAVWGVSFFELTHHMKAPEASFMIFLIFLGWAIGAPLFGLCVFLIKKNFNQLNIQSFVLCLLLGFIFLASIFWFLILYAHLKNLLWLWVFLFGFCSSAQVLIWTRFDHICPKNLSGLGIATTNMIIMFLLGLIHGVFGHVIQGKAGHLTQKNHSVLLLNSHEILRGLSWSGLCFALSLIIILSALIFNLRKTL